MLIDWVRHVARLGGELLGDPGHARLPSRGQFLRMLHRERARADRTGSQFSLLALGVDRGPPRERSWQSRATLRHLLRLLQRRLRLTDDVGWLDGRHLGVILPDTPAWGAWALVDDLYLALPTDIPLFECKVYVYPAEGPAAGRGAAEEAARTEPAAAGPHPAQPMEPLFIWRLPAWKRGLDIAGATLGLVLAAPVFLLIACAIKLSGRGPVLFVQWRRGLGGRPFRLFKFRSMTPDAENRKAEVLALNEQDGPAFKVKADPRVTPLGRWLRATSIDELPQLWNVLRGDMSLVGPRPLPLTEADACTNWHRRRLDATPGLTCTWQVRGRSRVTFDEWTRMDIRYMHSRSWWQDLKLLLQTIPALLFRRGW